jgi:hypothetical protein
MREIRVKSPPQKYVLIGAIERRMDNGNGTNWGNGIEPKLVKMPQKN